MAGPTRGRPGRTPGHVLYQLDSAGTAMAMEQTNASAAKSFLDTDGLGNVVNQVTTGNSMACAVVYDPFGGSIGAASGGNDMCASSPPSTTAPTTTGNALWYRGGSRDASTGDYQLGTRTYDPSSGAFTTPDAYRIADSATDLSVGVDPVTANTYSYVNGNPVNFADPGGHRRVCAGPSDTNCEDVRSEGPTTEDLKKMKAETDKLAAQKKGEATADFDWEGAIKTVLGEVSGVADLKRCVVDGDMGSCFWTIAGIVGASVFKAGKAIKAGAKLLKVYKAFEKGRKAAMEAVESYRKYGDYLDEALALSIKGDKAREAQKAKQAATAAKASKKQKAAAVCGFHSFSADTPVLMGDGSHKPIAEVKLGDKVVATDPETGKTATREVTALWIHQDTLTDLVIGGERIRTTEDHPFWSVTDQKFEDAQDLEPGEQVLTADGRTLEVNGLDAVSAEEGTAYNLTVDDLHTYYVGSAEVLVHNTGEECADAANGGPRTLDIGGGSFPGTSPKSVVRTPDGVVSINPNIAHGPSVVGRSQQLPFANNSFSNVTMNHFPADQFGGGTLSEVGRVLRPGGTLSISTGRRADVTGLLSELHQLGFSTQLRRAEGGIPWITGTLG